jgi:hypothetical protein
MLQSYERADPKKERRPGATMGRPISSFTPGPSLGRWPGRDEYPSVVRHAYVGLEMGSCQQTPQQSKDKRAYQKGEGFS